MNKKVKTAFNSFALIALSLCISCLGATKKKEVELSEKGKLLTSIAWKLDSNATLKGTTDVIEDSTSLIANITLEKDVKKIADFLAETVVFTIDAEDKSKLVYSRTIGEGFFSTSTTGYWKFNEDETEIIMWEWNEQTGKTNPPVTYKIIELSEEKFAMQKMGDASPNIYFPK